MKPIEFHPAARDEFREAVVFYKAINYQLGYRFDAENQRVLLEVGRNPKRYASFHPPAQRALCRRFPYSIVYLEELDRVWVVVVAHASRRPGYWVNRLGSG